MWVSNQSKPNRKKKTMNKSVQAHTLLLKNPEMKAKELAKKLKTNVTYAYTLIANFKKTPAGVASAKPKERMQTAAVLTSNTPVTKEYSSPRIFEQEIQAKWVEKKSPLLTQVGGDHYKDMAIQPMVYSMANKMDACQHTIIKYVSRFRDKGGIADLEKAKQIGRAHV